MNIKNIILKSRQSLLSYEREKQMFYFLNGIRYIITCVSVIAIGFFAVKLNYGFFPLVLNYFPIFILLHYSTYQSDVHDDKYHRIGYILVSAIIISSLIFPQYFGLMFMFESVLYAKIFVLPQLFMFIVVPIARVICFKKVDNLLSYWYNLLYQLMDTWRLVTFRFFV